MNPALKALISADLRAFFRDRRALAMSLLAPLVLGAFMGYFFSGDTQTATRIRCLVLDLDQSNLSRNLVKGLGGDKALEMVPTSQEAQARTEVRKGRAAALLLVPQGFGAGATKSLFGGGTKPTLTLVVDPSKATEAAMIRGLLAQHTMQSVSTEAFSGEGGLKSLESSLEEMGTSASPEVRSALRGLHGNLKQLQGAQNQGGASAGGPMAGGLTMPYELKEEAVTTRTGTTYNAYAQSFGGMGVQFVLFMGLEAGVALLTLRRSALWKRMRTAPVARRTFLTARILSASILAAFLMLAIFAVAIALFGVRIHGSLAGFLLVVVAFSLFTGAFGMLIAALGRTPEATRGLSIMATLFLLMIGGAWVPAFLFPPWVQKASFIFPTRWVLEGIQAMTWPGLPFSAALAPPGVLVGVPLGLGVLAYTRFPFDDQA